MNKCTELMGRICGHEWVAKIKRHRVKRVYYYHYISVCQHCGAVKGEKK